MQHLKLALIMTAMCIGLTGCTGCSNDDKANSKATNEAITKCMWDESGKCQQGAKEAIQAGTTNGKVDERAIKDQLKKVAAGTAAVCDNSLSDCHEFEAPARDVASNAQTKDPVIPSSIAEPVVNSVSGGGNTSSAW